MTMTTRFSVSIICALTVMTLSACAVFAGKSDFADYRAVRIAKDDQKRLLAMQQYIERHPDGRWAEEIQNERQLREADVYDRSKNDRKGLEFYVRAYPDGMYHAQALARLKATKEVDARREQALRRTEAADARRASQEFEHRRSWPTRFLSFWIKDLLWISNWGVSVQRLAEANREFSNAFGRPPKPRCNLEECAKFHFVRYVIPIPGRTRIERSFRIILRLRLQDGLVKRAEILMPDKGFSRWYELVNQHAIIDEDAQDRQQAFDWASSEIIRILKKTQLGIKPISGFTVDPVQPIKGDLTGLLADVKSQDPLQVIAGKELLEPGFKEKALTKKSEQKPAAASEEQAADMVMEPLEIASDNGGSAPGNPVPDKASKRADVSGKSSAENPWDNSGENVLQDRENDQNGPKLLGFQYKTIRGLIFAAEPGNTKTTFDGIIIEPIKAEPAKAE
jgi:hypothetical protein